MKLSAGTIGTLAFTALATAAFIWMAKRPAVDVSAMQFGIPAVKTASPAPQVVETKKTDDATVETTKAAESEDTGQSEPKKEDTATASEPATGSVTEEKASPDASNSDMPKAEDMPGAQAEQGKDVN